MDRQFDEQFDAFGFNNALESDPETMEAPYPDRQLDFGDEDYIASEGLLAEVLEAEDEAARDSEAEWLEAEWLETSGEAGSDPSIEGFAERLSREWSNRKPDGPAAEARRSALIEDHRATMAAARLRWSPKKVKPDFWSRVSRAWMTSREEEMRFETEAAQVAPVPMAPPAARVPLTEDRLVGGTLDREVKGKLVPGAKIAPFTLKFARALRARHRTVGMTNYHNHGGGAFNNRGYSLDLWLNATDERGFYRQEDALRLLRAVDAAARAVGGRWRILYNDFAVADAINRELGRRHVVFMGQVRREKKSRRVTGLNWHGPEPLILHFHLDITPVSGVDQEGEGEEEGWNEREEEWQGEEFEPEGEEEELDFPGRFDPETGTAGEGPWGESGEGEELDYEQSEASPLETAGLTPAERKALEITSTLETGKAGSFFGLTGNDDGQGLSFGLVNWPIGTGSLQPLLRDFATRHPDRWRTVFGPDAERFRAVIMPKGAEKAQLRFVIDEMNEQRTVHGKRRWFIKKPWVDYFQRLADDPEFRKIQVKFIKPMMRKADRYCREFGLKSEMAFAFMFDAVSSHGGAWLNVRGRRKLLDRKLADRGMAVGSASEADLLLAMADVLSETSKARYQVQVRQRKRWFVLGDKALELRRGLTGKRPSAVTPYRTAAPASRESFENEDLAWLAFEGLDEAQMFEDEGEWSGEGTFEAGEADEAGAFGEAEAFWGEEEASPSGSSCRCKGRQSEQLDEWRTFDEAAYFSADGEEEAGGEAFGEGPFEALLSQDEALAESVYRQEEEEGFADEAATDCSARLGNAECEPFRGQKKLIRAGSAKGLLLVRTVSDPRTELSLQFADYDINATNSQKEAHQDGIGQVTQFILARVRAGSPGVTVHLSGSASRTDSASYNRKLSCHRARCLASSIAVGLDAQARARTNFVIDDRGFDEAVCRAYPGGKGQNCELGEFRSVRVTVTGPNGKVIPVPISPAHDQFEIRVCRFEGKGLDVVAMDELLSRIPQGMPREVAEVLVKILKSRLMQAIEKRAPLLLKRALGAISAELKAIPIQFMRQRATFQIRERNKPMVVGRPAEVRTITLCYEGWGARLAIPFDTLVMDGIDEMLGRIRTLQRQPQVRRLLSEVLKKVLSPVLTQRLRLVGTEVPGNWKPFTTNKKVLIEKFAGKADILIDLLSSMVDPGTIHLAFEGFEWNPKINPSPNSLSCGDCSGPVIPLVVTGGGFDIWSVNTGSMTSKDCVCAPTQREQMLEYA